VPLLAFALSLSHESHRLHLSHLYRCSVFLFIDLSISLPRSTRTCSRSALSLSLSISFSLLSLSLSLSCSLCLSRVSRFRFMCPLFLPLSLKLPLPSDSSYFLCGPVFLLVFCLSLYVGVKHQGRQWIDHLPATGEEDGLDQRTQRQQRRE
jgi:hypothetical protein